MADKEPMHAIRRNDFRYLEWPLENLCLVVIAVGWMHHASFCLEAIEFRNSSEHRMLERIQSVEINYIFPLVDWLFGVISVSRH